MRREQGAQAQKYGKFGRNSHPKLFKPSGYHPQRATRSSWIDARASCPYLGSREHYHPVPRKFVIHPLEDCLPGVVYVVLVNVKWRNID